MAGIFLIVSFFPPQDQVSDFSDTERGENIGNGNPLLTQVGVLNFSLYHTI